MGTEAAGGGALSPRTANSERKHRSRQKKRAFVAWYKAGQCCARCKSVVHPCALDFDHDGEKGGNIADLVVDGSIKKLLLELSRVVLL